jgi:hypothetical protein
LELFGRFVDEVPQQQWCHFPDENEGQRVMAGQQPHQHAARKKAAAVVTGNVLTCQQLNAEDIAGKRLSLRL